jgi:hypothetical protein
MAITLNGDTDLIITDYTNSLLKINGTLLTDDSTNVTTNPPISFIGDTDTGIGHSAANTLDLVTNGQPRFRVESTGQIKAVYESYIGPDYNTTMHNGWLCRAWVNFNGESATPITPRASGNVSSISVLDTGYYAVTMLVAMPDANYALSVAVNSYAGNYPHLSTPRNFATAGQFQILAMTTSFSQGYSDQVFAMVVR